MGHQRLGSIPTSRKWSDVVGEVGGPPAAEGQPPTAAAQDIPDIAQRTLEAAEEGLRRAIDDVGLRFTFYLLTQVVLAARDADWRQELGALGIRLGDEASVFEFTSELQRVIDEHLEARGGATEVSEMAQQAAGEALATLAGPRAATLFGNDQAELQQAVRSLSTKAGFCDLGQRFFACFMARFLNFYLCRITAGQVGGGRIAQVDNLSEFNNALQTHCLQSARLVHDYCGDWYSKTEFQKGIDLDNTSHFMAVAVKKFQAELRRQREEGA
jgi:hypothetical protein